MDFAIETTTTSATIILKVAAEYFESTTFNKSAF